MINSRVLTVTGHADTAACSVDECAAYLPRLRFLTKRRNRKSYLYATEYAVLDTETSHAGEDAGWVYQWAFKLADLFIIGRRPSEFIRLLELLRDHYELSGMKSIIIYVHNLSYDFQYLKWDLKRYDPNLSVMATDAHSVLIADIFGFRLLCSYKLSGLSLDLFAKTYAETYRKAYGLIDYNIIRYQDDELTPDDWEYMLSDVAAQHDAIRGLLTAQGYKYAYQAPYTSTGFVRTDCRKASEKYAFNWNNKFKISALDLEQYKLCRAAFMGGITIASWHYAGLTVRSDRLRHLDFTSSYPARQMLDYFPKGKPMWYGVIDDMDEFRDVLDTYCCIFILTLHNVKIRPGITAPYIPSSKCRLLQNGSKLNGKVTSADALTIVVTEIDYKWIQRQYTWTEMAVDMMLTFVRGRAPAFLRRKVMDYFDAKCKLKRDDPRLYMASKAKLNGIYGMTATAIIRDSFKLDDELFLRNVPDDDQDQLRTFYNSRNSFLPYQLGIYTTAWARDALMTMIECVGYDNFLYCDTDSVFYLETDQNRQRIDEMNAALRERALKAGAFIDDNILGYATPEPRLRAFRALHAKCYALEEWNGIDYALRVVIAGIPKRATVWEHGTPRTVTNAEELGCIDNLEDGFVFRHCGGNRVIYNEDRPRIENINGHETEISSSAVITPIEKEINDTMYVGLKDGTIFNYQFEQIIE